jgi:hypothetical protein
VLAPLLEHHETLVLAQALGPPAEELAGVGHPTPGLARVRSLEQLLEEMRGGIGPRGFLLGRALRFQGVPLLLAQVEGLLDAAQEKGQGHGRGEEAQAEARGGSTRRATTAARGSGRRARPDTSR